MLDGRDDVEALTRVLNGLAGELTQQREEIDSMCQIADQIGGLEPLDFNALQAQLKEETELTKCTMNTLSIAESELESIMKMVRDFSRAQTIQSLSLQKQCGDQIFQWSEKTDKEYMELIDLQRKCSELDSKLGKLAAYLS